MRLFTPLIAGLLLLPVATLACAQAPAAKSAYKLEVVADRPEAIYKTGEEATFRVRLLKNDQPAAGIELSYSLSVDGFKTLKEAKLTSAAEPVTITGKLAEPGFLQLRVWCKPEGGAMVTTLAG